MDDYLKSLLFLHFLTHFLLNTKPYIYIYIYLYEYVYQFHTIRLPFSKMRKDVIQVTHRDDIPDLLRKGRIIERNVLVNALQAHLEDRIISYDNKCIVFGD